MIMSRTVNTEQPLNVLNFYCNVNVFCKSNCSTLPQLCTSCSCTMFYLIYSFLYLVGFYFTLLNVNALIVCIACASVRRFKFDISNRAGIENFARHIFSSHFKTTQFQHSSAWFSHHTFAFLKFEINSQQIKHIKQSTPQ